MIKPTVVALDNKRLFVELPIDLVFDLLADIQARYERLFSMWEPVYPQGKPEFLFRILVDGYGLEECGANVHADVINLRTAKLVAADEVDDQWKELGVSRLLVRIFGSTIRGSEV